MGFADIILPFIVLLPFVTAPFIALFAKKERLASAWGAGIVAIVLSLIHISEPTRPY